MRDLYNKGLRRFNSGGVDPIPVEERGDSNPNASPIGHPGPSFLAAIAAQQQSTQQQSTEADTPPPRPEPILASETHHYPLQLRVVDVPNLYANLDFNHDGYPDMKKVKELRKLNKTLTHRGGIYD